jgi:hypothetical protein
MRQFRALLALCVLTWLSTTAMARAQLTCDAPLATPLGVSQTATLLSFPAYQFNDPCSGAVTIQHAAFHSFTAPQDGWYSLHLVPTDPTPWIPRIALLESCGAPQALSWRSGRNGRPLCSQGDSSLRQFAGLSFQLAAGQSRIIVIGGNDVQDAGNASLHLTRIGDTPMDGAQPLQLGGNPNAFSALEPWLSYRTPCDGWVYSSARFTFTPATTGIYRFGFCGTAHGVVAVSTSPYLDPQDTISGMNGCPNSGGRISAALKAGTTYYIAAGSDFTYDSCWSYTATVEYIDPCPGDLNDSGDVDGADLSLLLTGWGTDSGDITGDGVVNGVDLAILIAMWGVCPKG